MSVLERLTEGIVDRDLEKEGAALMNKWNRTGLLEGIGNERAQHNMARLLENQAKELLRESSAMASSDVEGFASVAFPIVRRVFGGLIANDLVSVQPMSLPSGLIFFLDFQFNGARVGIEANDSVYGGGRVAAEITGGVLLTGENAEESFYALNNGYSSATGSITVGAKLIVTVASGTVGGASSEWTGGPTSGVVPGAAATNEYSVLMDKLVQYDPDIASGSKVAICRVSSSTLTDGQFNLDDYITLDFTTGFDGGRVVRRLTRKDPLTGSFVLFVVEATGSESTLALSQSIATTTTVNGVIADNFSAGGSTGAVIGEATWQLEGNAQLPEIDIKVDSVAVTAMTKKLKAKWTPELGQDLNAYHNIDAEVELTGILSEQIALEIDREIVNDLVKGATAGTYYWSRSPGMFLHRTEGTEIGASSAAPDFTGTVSEWYETLIETINDVSAQIHRKTLRGGANFVVCGPEVANVLEFTAGFRASVTADDERGVIGGVKVGSLSRKFDVYVDPYFVRNVILVGRKGSGFLESGYVYAPYVPLQVTPTIFGTEDFVPRKGVMTRYAKKMVRPDMYGLVIVRGLLGEAGATA
jgi:hypothetical protein